MTMPGRVALAWSGGKDSTMTLAKLRTDPHYEVDILVTTVTEDYQRISLHGVRRELLEAQAQAVGFPLTVVYDAAFLRDLPAHVDPCGERGEFHTFVYDGPIFHHR